MDYSSLTNEQIDRLVAEKVMEWVHCATAGWWNQIIPHRRDGRYQTGKVIQAPGNEDIPVWSPSSNISHAWEVSEKMRADGYTCFKLECPGFDNWLASFICSLGPCKRHGTTTDNHHGSYDVEAMTACRAICEAALKAVDDA